MMTKEEIIKDAKEHNVYYIRLSFTDINGMIKNVEIPFRKLEAALNNEIMFDGSSIDGFARIHEADMYLRPDLNTWVVLPFEKDQYGTIANLTCDVYLPNGEPFEGDPRYVLKRNIEKLKEFGHEYFKVGVEPEFFLFHMDENKNITLNPNDHGNYFDMAPIDGAENCRREIVLELEKLNFKMEASHHEAAPGQHEINFEFHDALEAADKLQLFKIVVKKVARRHNLHATFMPKPVDSVNGSGMHVNASISDREGNNVFFDPKGNYDGLSQTMEHFIAGLIKHARAFTAITNPIVNSYKRLVPGYEAPSYISWSDDNRSVMIRIPTSRGKGTRAEVRSADPSSNPYLALAVILASGLDGIKNKENLMKPVYINLYDLDRDTRESMGIKNLPENLKDALKELKRDDVVKDALGKHVFDKFYSAKKFEWESYRKSVTDWEVNHYLKTM